MPNITIYSTPTCSYCRMAKAFLDKHNVSYTNIDVSRNQAKAEEMIQKSGQMGVPVIEVDGKIVVGFDQDELAKLVGIAQ